MNENDYVELLLNSLSADEEELPTAIEKAKTAIELFPTSPKLYCILGDLTLRRLDPDDHEIKQAQSCYEKALELNDQFAEAYESLGYLHDVRHDNFKLAEFHFRKAISFGAGADSYKGLARSLAQAGRKSEALQLLSPQNPDCPQSESIQRMNQEIENGDWDPIFIEP